MREAPNADSAPHLGPTVMLNELIEDRLQSDAVKRIFGLLVHVVSLQAPCPFFQCAVLFSYGDSYP